MKIKAEKLGSLLTVTIGFFTAQFDMNKVEETLETFLHFARLAKIPLWDQKEETEKIELIRHKIKFFLSAYNSIEGGEYEYEAEFNVDDNTITTPEIKISKMTIKVGDLIETIQREICYDEGVDYDEWISQLNAEELEDEEEEMAGKVA